MELLFRQIPEVRDLHMILCSILYQITYNILNLAK